jgi:hypothetical protein
MGLSNWRRGWRLGLFLSLAVPAASGCATDEAAVDEDGEYVEPVTDVNHTAVRNQSIGNCWSYAATGWAESLHRARTGQDINISESYITFWDWYGKITGGRVTTTAGRAEVPTGGWWDGAMTILKARGVVYEAEFIPEEATADRSTRQADALRAINAALNEGGALATAASRRDPALVLQTLFTAWQLSPAVRAEITRVFGARGATTLPASRTTADGFFRPVSSIPVRTSAYSSGRGRSVDGTLADVIGYGRYAWRSASYGTTATARAGFQQRVIRALNDNQPVLISWLVDFNAMSSQGVFRMSSLTAPGRQGGHLTSMEDYQVVIRQPGQAERTLRAGELASEADQDLAARYGTLEFIRIKNSWGTARDPSGTGYFGGYTDLYVDYLNGPITWSEDMSMRTPLSSVILPPGY